MTTRNSGANILQDLNYTFDPVGNITEMRDNALQTHYFQNSVVSPNGKYEYDALYRLTRSTGREHYGQAQISHNDFSINTAVPQNNNANAVENYTETYEYDEIGNILKLIHQATSGNWTRGYYYDSSTSNYLLKTSLPGDTVSDSNTYSASYTHDTHGNITSMPHLSSMIWDFHDQLREVDLGGGGTAWYVYDAHGTRVRKVIENGTLKKDRIYLDEINEYYREYISGSKDYERETLHIMDDRKRLAVVETKTWDTGSAVVTPSPVIRYQFDNHLGSASLELDTSAAIISYEEFHPFGTSAYRLGSSVSEVSMKRYRYVGKERDDESGLYYYGARYYAAWLCRFVSVDPRKDDYPMWSSYVYAGNMPVTLTDVNGEGPGDGDSEVTIEEDEDIIPEEWWLYDEEGNTGWLNPFVAGFIDGAWESGVSLVDMAILLKNLFDEEYREEFIKDIEYALEHIDEVVEGMVEDLEDWNATLESAGRRGAHEGGKFAFTVISTVFNRGFGAFMASAKAVRSAAKVVDKVEDVGDVIKKKKWKWKAKSDKIGDVFNADLANHIEEIIPGKISGIDLDIFSVSLKKRLTDIDINFDGKAHIEVKSGTSRLKLKQMKNQIALAKEEGAEYIFYAENLTRAQKFDIRKNFGNINIISSRKELTDYLKKI